MVGGDESVYRLLVPPAIVAKGLALLAEMLRMNLALIGHVQSVRLLQWPLLVRVDVYVTFNALLAHIGPAVARHPFALALGTLVLSEASFLPLIRSQAFAFWPGLRAVFDIVALLEAQVTEVTRRRPLGRFPLYQA